MNNFKMDSGSWGYMTLTSTAIRVSNAYSRQSSYSPAFGVAEKGVSPALLTPNKYSNVFTEMLESYTDEKLTSIASVIIQQSLFLTIQRRILQAEARP